MTSFMKSKLLKMLSQGAKSLGAMIQVKLGRPALHHVLRLCGALGRRNNIGVVKVILTYLAFLHRLQKRNGLTYMVKFMKSAQVLMMQSLGGQRLYNLNPLGPRLARTKGGLPRVIPALHRVRIRCGDRWTVRLWQSLFGLYRVIEIPGTLKLKTITDPSTMEGWVLSEFSKFVSEHWKVILPRLFNGAVARAYGPSGPLSFLKGLKAKPFLVSKSTSAIRRDVGAASNHSPISSSPSGVLASAILWRKSSLYPFLTDWCKMTGNIWILNRIDSWGNPEKTGVHVNDFFDTRDLKSPLLQSDINQSDWEAKATARRAKQKFPSTSGVSVGDLGRLAGLDEPAGKVRVVAMVDIFTQWVLHPLHEALFDLLRKIPTDGTFDQLRPIHRLLKRKPQGPFYSYDLSAATDRLPLQIQKCLLSPILTSWGAEVWGTLLVGRPYVILHKGALGLPEIGRGDLRQVEYATGQPMGAYSSWAMLAFTHHSIVQWAALRAGVITCGSNWFLDYALLGDDIVIANKLVAEEYGKLMAALGVEIGLHKSLISVRGLALEFAKRFFLNGGDASMAPVAEYWAAKGNLPASLQLATKYGLTLSQYLTVMGYGYRSKGSLTARLVSLPKRLQNYVISYYSPAGPGFKGLREFFALRSVNSSYKINDTKVAALVESFFSVEIKKLIEKIDNLDPLVKEIKTLVTVARDRQHYGTAPRGPDRQIVFRDLFYAESGVSSPVGWDIIGSVVDSVKETVYREAFWDTIIRLRDLRNQLEELKVDSLTWESFESLLDTCREIDTELGALPLPKDLYARRAEMPNLKLEFSWTKLWKSYSSHFRTTRAT
nr:MAG: RNA-dependent RNA polymerase [Mitovirus sp.]